MQEQWRCLHENNTTNYITETNYLINYFENPKGQKITIDCPVIDPNDPKWCPENSNGKYYRIPCNIAKANNI